MTQEIPTLEKASSSPKNRARWAVILIAVLLLASFAGVAMAKKGKRGFLPPAGYLDLTEEQAAVAETIIKGTIEANAPLRQEARELKQNLRELLEADPQDSAAIGEVAIDLHAVRDQIRAARDVANTEFEAVLDADQLVKWQNFRELRALKRGPRQGDGDSFESN